MQLDSFIMYGVILAGGGGARLWPLSREHHPKQFLSLGGKRTLFEQTVLRIRGLIPPERMMVVTKEEIVLETKAQIAAMRSHFRGARYRRALPVRVLREPQGRNTAAAVGLAAIVLSRLDPDAVMAVLPADHLIQKNSRFVELLKFAGRIAQQDRLVTFGVRPTRPETGYGYIKVDRRYMSGNRLEAFQVARFVEKPGRPKALRYMRSGRYFWNSGIFVWKVSLILQEIRAHLPTLYAGLMEIRDALGTSLEEETLRRVYGTLDPISIDYGVLEKSQRVVVAPADIGWSDVGDWMGVHRLQPHDAAGNSRIGDSMNLDSRNSMVFADKRVIATIGLSDVFVVDTDDALLVCRRDRTQDVKTIVDTLKRRKAPECIAPKMLRKPWGTFDILQSGPTFQVNHIVLNPGASISLQVHRHRSEHWVVVSGEAKVMHGRRIVRLKTNESTYIPAGTRHRLSNASAVRPLEVIEVQSGEYLAEDDIIRYAVPSGRLDPSPPLTSTEVTFS